MSKKKQKQKKKSARWIYVICEIEEEMKKLWKFFTKTNCKTQIRV